MKILLAAIFVLVLPSCLHAAVRTVIEAAQVEIEDEQAWDSALAGFLGGGSVLEIVPDVQFCLQSLGRRECSQICQNSRTCVWEGRLIAGETVDFVVVDVDQGGNQFMAEGRFEMNRCRSGACSVRTGLGAAHFQFILSEEPDPAAVRKPERRPSRAPPVAQQPGTVPPGTTEPGQEAGGIADAIEEQLEPFADCGVVETNRALDKVATAALYRARWTADRHGGQSEYGGLIVQLEDGSFDAGVPQPGSDIAIHYCSQINSLVPKGYARWIDGNAGCCLDKNGLAWEKSAPQCVRLVSPQFADRARVVANFHTHPPSGWWWLGGNLSRNYFSASDMTLTYKHNLGFAYMLTPGCMVRVYARDERVARPYELYDIGNPTVMWHATCRVKDLFEISALPSCD